MNVDENREACVGCGRPTAVGTALFSERRTTSGDEGPIYLCGDCNERAVSVFGRRPTAEDIREIKTTFPGGA